MSRPRGKVFRCRFDQLLHRAYPRFFRVPIGIVIPSRLTWYIMVLALIPSSAAARVWFQRLASSAVSRYRRLNSATASSKFIPSRNIVRATIRHCRPISGNGADTAALARTGSAARAAEVECPGFKQLAPEEAAGGTDPYRDRATHSCRRPGSRPDVSM